MFPNCLARNNYDKKNLKKKKTMLREAYTNIVEKLYNYHPNV